MVDIIPIRVEPPSADSQRKHPGYLRCRELLLLVIAVSFLLWVLVSLIALVRRELETLWGMLVGVAPMVVAWKLLSPVAERQSHRDREQVSELRQATMESSGVLPSTGHPAWITREGICLQNGDVIPWSNCARVEIHSRDGPTSSVEVHIRKRAYRVRVVPTFLALTTITWVIYTEFRVVAAGIQSFGLRSDVLAAMICTIEVLALTALALFEIQFSRAFGISEHRPLQAIAPSHLVAEDVISDDLRERIAERAARE